MSGGALWRFALETYGRDGAEETLLALQDDHGQCVAFLLWSLWLAAEKRVPDAVLLARAGDLARAWEAAATAPLRALRRSLTHAPAAAPKTVREGLRSQVKALELQAERRLLEMLEAASAPAIVEADVSLAEGLRRAVQAWGGPPPAQALLARLAAVASGA